MNKFLTTVFLLLFAFGVKAQVVTTDPTPLQQNSTDVTIYFHADRGDAGMKGLASTTAVYAHIGCHTNLGEWRYAPSKWCDNAAKYKLEYVSTDLWKLTLGDMRKYFGITDDKEIINNLAIVFRNSDGSKSGRDLGGADIFVPVQEPGFVATFLADRSNTVISEKTTITFTLTTSENAALEIAVNGTPIANATGAKKLEKSHTFTEIGTYNVTYTANNGEKTLTGKIVVSWPKPSVAGTYPGGTPKQGAVKNADGTVTFCLAAPKKTSVMLVGSWDDYQLLDNNIMKYQDYNGYRYFWITVNGLKDNQYYPYYYLVDGQHSVGDPYAELVLDPYSDKYIQEGVWPDMPKYPVGKVPNCMMAAYRGDMNNYKFSSFSIPKRENLTIYEMLFRDFTGEDGEANGSGTVRKAIEKIPYLSELGVNAVELMPIMEFNGNNSWGYNTNFYFAPDKAYGSPKDYKDFIEECHRSGIAVILDIAFNHSDGLHPWYQMYDIKENPFYNEVAPHAYGVLNDWNQDNPLVMQQWKDCLKYWLKVYNVDGFRFDLVKGIGSNNSYGGDTEKYNSSRIANTKALHAAMKEIKADAIHINENLAGYAEENDMAADGQLNWANLNSFSCEYALGSKEGIGQFIRFLSSSDTRTEYSTVAYAESHDEERMGYKQIAYGTTNDIKKKVDVRMARLGAVAVQMLMTPGPKMIWQFGELGADQTTKDGSNNDTSAKTVVWNYLNDPYRANLHKTYKALCDLRKYNGELFTRANFTQTNLNQGDLTKYRTIRLTNGNKEVVALINPRTSTGKLTIGTATSKIKKDNAVVIASSFENPTINNTSSGITVSVPDGGYIVLATNNLSAIDDVAVDAEADCGAFATAGGVTVFGNFANGAIYDLSGRVVANISAAGYYDLSAGIYVVKLDNFVTKVAVR